MDDIFSERRLRSLLWLGHVIRKYYEWITYAYLDRHCTGRFRGLREVQVVRVQTEEHSQQRFVKDGNHLGGSRSGSSKQIRMASECGPMHPLGCGLNQGQGQTQGHKISSRFPYFGDRCSIKIRNYVWTLDMHKILSEYCKSTSVTYQEK